MEKNVCLPRMEEITWMFATDSVPFRFRVWQS